MTIRDYFHVMTLLFKLHLHYSYQVTLEGPPLSASDLGRPDLLPPLSYVHVDAFKGARSAYALYTSSLQRRRKTRYGK